MKDTIATILRSTTATETKTVSNCSGCMTLAPSSTARDTDNNTIIT